MPAFAGYSGRVIFNGATVLRIHRYSIDNSIQDLDTSHFENASGQEEWTAGLERTDIELDAVWRSEDNPFGAPLFLIPGTYAGPLAIILDRANAPAVGWQIPNVLVLRIRMNQAVRTAIEYSISMRSHVSPSVSPFA